MKKSKFNNNKSLAFDGKHRHPPYAARIQYLTLLLELYFSHNAANIYLCDLQRLLAQNLKEAVVYFVDCDDTLGLNSSDETINDNFLLFCKGMAIEYTNFSNAVKHN